MNRFLTPAEVAALVGVKEKTLAAWRQAGTGPRHSRLGHRTVRYAEADVRAWIAAKRPA